MSFVIRAVEPSDAGVSFAGQVGATRPPFAVGDFDLGADRDDAARRIGDALDRLVDVGVSGDVAL